MPRGPAAPHSAVRVRPRTRPPPPPAPPLRNPRATGGYSISYPLAPTTPPLFFAAVYRLRLAWTGSSAVAISTSPLPATRHLPISCRHPLPGRPCPPSLLSGRY